MFAPLIDQLAATGIDPSRLVAKLPQAVLRVARSSEWGNAFGRIGRRPLGLNRLAPAHPQTATPTVCRDTVVVAGSDFVCGGAACRSW
jgi:hypothetical protein